MQNKVGKNYIFNMLYQVLIIVLPFITTPYVSRVLGADGVGIYNYTYAVVTAFTLVAVLGTNSFAIREIAYNQGDKKACTSIFYEVVALRMATTLVLIPIYVLTVFVTGKYYIVYIATFTYLIGVPLDISWFFQGLEEFKKTVVRNTIVRLIGVLLVFVFVKAPEDVWKYSLIMGGTALIGHLALWLYLPKYIGRFDKNDFHPIRHIKAVFAFFIPALSIYVYTSLDKIVLGTFSTEAEVGYYSQSEKIVKLVITVIVALSTVMMPRMANLIKKGKLDEVKGNMDKAYQFVLVLSLPMMVGLAVIDSYFVPLFLGVGFEKSITVMYILIPLIIIMGLSSMTGTMVMIAMGKQKQYNIIVIIASTINLLLNLLLVRGFASHGVAIGTIVAETFVTIAQLYFMREMIDFKAFFYRLIRYALNSLIMGLVIIVLKPIFNPSWSSIIILVVIGIIIYSCLLILQKDEMFKMAAEYAKNSISRMHSKK